MIRMIYYEFIDKTNTEFYAECTSLRYAQITYPHLVFLEFLLFTSDSSSLESRIYSYYLLSIVYLSISQTWCLHQWAGLEATAYSMHLYRQYLPSSPAAFRGVCPRHRSLICLQLVHVVKVRNLSLIIICVMPWFPLTCIPTLAFTRVPLEQWHNGSRWTQQLPYRIRRR